MTSSKSCEKCPSGRTNTGGKDQDAGTCYVKDGYTCKTMGDDKDKCVSSMGAENKDSGCLGDKCCKSSKTFKCKACDSKGMCEECVQGFTLDEYGECSSKVSLATKNNVVMLLHAVMMFFYSIFLCLY